MDGAYFDVMGLRPVVGRLLKASDDGPKATGAVVLTFRFWSNTLHADRSVIGKSIRLSSGYDTRSAVIVGVLEPSVPYPVETELIANVVTSPHHLSATMVTSREHRMTEVFGRLAPGVDLESARAELRTGYSAMLAAHPEVYKPAAHFRIDVTRMHDQINSRARTVLWVLLAASALLFVIACANVANLILARAVRRESEFALRAALGATGGVIRRSLLAEGLILCGSGCLASIVLAVPMFAVLGRYASRFSVRALDLTLDSSLLWIGVPLALAAAVFLAYVPRLGASQGLVGSGSGARVAGGGGRRLRAFAVTQIAASFLLLAGVLLTTLLALERTQPAFDTAHVLVVNLPVMTEGRTPDQVYQFYRETQRHVSAVPGVERVATGLSAPWRDARWVGVSFAFSVEGLRREDSKDDLRARFRTVSPGYFATLGIPIIAGRDFNEGDRRGAERVVIISNSLAQQLFHGREALNRHLMWTDPVMKFIDISTEPRRIVASWPTSTMRASYRPQT